MRLRGHRTLWQVLFTGAGAVLLVACTVPPPAADGGPSSAVGKPDVPGLQPLTRELSVPAGALPRSAVPSVRYDLASSGMDELAPDDGVAGDAGPRAIFQRGGASWYGMPFHMRKTANGERFDMGALTAAHRTLPFGTVVCVRSLVNGREVLVRINDRGPFGPGRIIDLSRAAADALGMVSMGIKQVALHVIDAPDMRCNGEAADVAALPSPSEVAQAPVVERAARSAVPARRRR